MFANKEPFKCYVTQMGVGWGVRFSRKKRYEGVRCNVISITRGWVGIQFPEKKCCVTLEWPLISLVLGDTYRGIIPPLAVPNT